ncbi:MAG: hypothetical protein N2111_07735 [Candidatus Sumerlaeaceae bacterium]|nr:hypothetical protein [Candidatus Sumerlaeaceae bacterium]
MKVESTRAVGSPNGQRTVVVDHRMPVRDGRPDLYSGQMLIRVTDKQGGVRQRLVEGSQARIIESPVWLDDRWVAYAYNISKNAVGMVYFDTETGRALVAEQVAVLRRMGGTGAEEFELMSFDVTEYDGDRVTALQNLVSGSGSVFPLPIKSVPQYKGAVHGKEFLNQLTESLAALRSLLEKQKVASIAVEQGSETFTEDGKRAGMLVCADGAPAAVIVPVGAASPKAALEAAIFARLADDVQLTCQHPVTEDEDAQTTPPAADETTTEPSVEVGWADRYRFTTEWKNPRTLQVDKEVFETEDEPPRKEPWYTLTADGKLTRIAPEKK